jgi:peptidoglycan/LPS O-acetylase OafA/YrhL
MNEKYAWVNALRGYAILLVVLIHSSQHFSVSSYLKVITDDGYLGVQLFFIMSSFTLFNSYAKRKIENERNLKTKFFIRRYFRIAPYYYLAGIIYILYRLFAENQTINVNNVIANYTFLNGVYLPGINYIPPGGWSVGVEMLFYLFIPILFRYIDSLRKAVLLFFVSMFISIIINQYFIDYTSYYISLIWDDVSNWAFYQWLPYQFPVFVLGIILYFFKKNFVLSIKNGQIILILSIVTYFLFSIFNLNNVSPFYLIPNEYIYGLIFVCFAIGVYTTSNKLILNSFVQKLGVVSFSVYLNHFMVLNILGRLYSGFCKFLVVHLHLPDVILRNDLVFLISYIFVVYISFIISKQTYKHFEIKGIKLGNKLIDKFV